MSDPTWPEIVKMALQWTIAVNDVEKDASITTQLARGVLAMDAELQRIADEPPTVKRLPVARLDDMWLHPSDEERIAFLQAHPCCRACGSLDTRYQCSNDE